MRDEAQHNIIPPAEIAVLAEQIYLASGCLPGRDLENWLAADAQLRRKEPATPLDTAGRAQNSIQVLSKKGKKGGLR
jgi:hypothetical protein